MKRGGEEGRRGGGEEGRRGGGEEGGKEDVPAILALIKTGSTTSHSATAMRCMNMDSSMSKIVFTDTVSKKWTDSFQHILRHQIDICKFEKYKTEMKSSPRPLVVSVPCPLSLLPLSLSLSSLPSSTFVKRYPLMLCVDLGLAQHHHVNVRAEEVVILSVRFRGSSE